MENITADDARILLAILSQVSFKLEDSKLILPIAEKLKKLIPPKVEQKPVEVEKSIKN